MILHSKSRQKSSSIRHQIKSFAHVKYAFRILAASIVILILSIVIQSSSIQPILQNIFAGLITGLVITFIGSIKGKTLKNLEIKKALFEKIDKLYKSGNEAYWEYNKHKDSDDDEEYFVATYDLVCELQNMETFITSKDSDERIHEILGKKPSDYLSSIDKYDLSEQNHKYENLFSILDSETNIDISKRKEIDELIRAIRNQHRIICKIASSETSKSDDAMIEVERAIL